MIHSFFTRKLPDNQLQGANVSYVLQEEASTTKRAKIKYNSLIIKHLPPPPTGKYSTAPKESFGQSARRNAKDSQARGGAGIPLKIPP